MKARYLDNSVEFKPGNRRISDFQKIVVIEKFTEYIRVDKQCGVGNIRIGYHQGVQFTFKFSEQVLGRRSQAHRVTNLAFHVHGFGERAEVQPDHSTF